ncbi:MAG: DUF4974 domain-containing protein, partial [Planctomycetota bacterium]
MNRQSPQKAASQQPARRLLRRLVCHRSLPIAAALSVASTLMINGHHANAQFALPGELSVAPSPDGAPSTLPTASSPASLENGRTVLSRARQAMRSKDFKSAVTLYRQAGMMTRTVPALGPEVARLASELHAAGIDKALLMPPKTAGFASAKPMSTAAVPDVATRKAEALRLLAIGRSALDRGDTATALTLARQAETRNVPESAYQTGEPRVWQFLLDAESAAKRSGVMQTNAVAPALASTPLENSNLPGMPKDVKQAQFQFGNNGQPGSPSSVSDFGQIAQVQGTAPIQNITPLPLNAGNLGEQLFQEGMQELASGNSEAARAKFVKAWQYESTMPSEFRNALKEKLTLVQGSRLPTTRLPADGAMAAMDKADLATQKRAQRLYREVTAELAKVNEIKKDEPLEAVDNLESLMRRIDGSDADAGTKRSLSAMVNNSLREQKRYVENNRAQIDLDLQNESVRMDIENESRQQAAIDAKVSAFVDEYNDLMKQKRFEEAEVIAKQVAELKPDETIAINMFHKSRMGTRLRMNEQIAADKEDGFSLEMLDVERASAPMDPSRPFQYLDADEWNNLSTRRLANLETGRGRTPAENAIYAQLDGPIQANFDKRPLAEVMNQISAVTNVPIVIDNLALQRERIDSSVPLTLNIETQIPLKNALNLLLRDYDLTYMVKNEVLMITTQEVKRSNVITRTYRVTSLVTPIPNFAASSDNGLQSALQDAYQMANPVANVQVMPFSALDMQPGPQFASNPTMAANPMAMGQYAPGGMSGGLGMNEPMGGGSMADFSQLMQLIQTTIEPETWEALGGPSTMFPYSANLSLVVSTTSDVHDQIADLLESLRRLQNLQITIEVRFITLSDSFFERIGVDFDVQFD